MKILALPVDAVAAFPKGKRPIPRKFKYEDLFGQAKEIKVDSIISLDETKVAGVKAFIYCCQSVIDGVEKRYELKYLISECRWELYKM